MLREDRYRLTREVAVLRAQLAASEREAEELRDKLAGADSLIAEWGPGIDELKAQIAAKEAECERLREEQANDYAHWDHAMRQELRAGEAEATINAVDRVVRERDAAIARAEAAEKERDEEDDAHLKTTEMLLAQIERAESAESRASLLESVVSAVKALLVECERCSAPATRDAGGAVGPNDVGGTWPLCDVHGADIALEHKQSVLVAALAALDTPGKK
jgi:hypothetical protein